jgi:hypothetical protein
MTVHVDNQYIWQLWIKYVRSAQSCVSVGRWVRRFITSWLFTYSTLWHSGWSEQPLAFHSSAYQMCYSGCGLGCPAFEHRWWRKFPDPFVSALRSTHPSVQWVPGLSFGGKATGDCRWPSTAFWRRVQLYLELNLCLSSEFVWLVAA